LSIEIGSPVREGRVTPLMIAAFVVLPVVYLIYLIESFCSATSAYLWNFSPDEDIVSYVKRLRTYAPVLSFHCECYHYRTYVTYSTDSKGNQTSQTHTEKVTTHTETQRFPYSRCVDDSGDISENVFVYNSTRVDFSKDIQFGDDRTAFLYNSAKSAFIERNKYRDTHFDFAEHKDLQDFKEKVLSIVDTKQVSCFMSWGVYFVLTVFCMMSAPYRIWLDNNSIHAKFVFIKKIFV